MHLQNFMCLLLIFLATCFGLESSHKVRNFLWKSIVNINANNSLVNQ